MTERGTLIHEARAQAPLYKREVPGVAEVLLACADQLEHDAAADLELDNWRKGHAQTSFGAFTFPEIEEKLRRLEELERAAAGLVAVTAEATETHEIVWDFDDGWVRGKLSCNDDDCQYRYVCSGDCEVIFDIEKTETGYRHQVNYYEDDRPSNVWHEMRKADYCNFVEFMDAGDLPEQNEERDSFEIGRTPVEPVWQGEDGVNWKRLGVSL